MGISWEDVKSVGADILPYVGAGVGGLVAGPVGAGIGYGAGSMVGNWIDPNDPNGGGASGAEAAKVQSFANAQGKYANYRGQMVGERNQAMQNQMSAYTGAQNALMNMYGGAPSMSFAPMQGAQRLPLTQRTAGDFNPATSSPGVRTTSWQPSTAPVQSVGQTNAAIGRALQVGPPPAQKPLTPTPVAGASKLAGASKSFLKKDLKPVTSYSPAQVRASVAAAPGVKAKTTPAPRKLTSGPTLKRL